MKPSHRSPPRRRPSLLLAALVTACAPELEPVRPVPADYDGPRAQRGVPAYDFVAQHAVAERWSEVDAIATARFGARRHLTRGWSYPGGASDAEIPADERLWSDAREAEVTFQLREAAGRTLDFRLKPLLQAGERMAMTFTLNGTPIQELEQGGGERRIRLALPAEAQRVGLNHLGMAFSSTHRMDEVVEGSDDYRRLSAGVGELTFEIGDRAVARRAREARQLLPNGSRAVDGALEGGVLYQVSGSLLRYHLRMPRSAQLATGVALLGRGSGRPAEAEFRIALTPEGGAREVVARGRARMDGGASSLAADLSPFAGRIVRLELELEAPEAPGEPVLGAWLAPGLWGDGEAPAAHAEPDALAAARAALHGAPVVAILLDACAAAHLHAYGGRAGLTPHLDRLAADGALFESAYAPATYTISSIASMLTSRRVWDHATWAEGTRLGETLPTWPERFREAGYQTFGIVHSPNGSSIFGFERGFEAYEEVFRHASDRPTPLAESVLPALDSLLARRDERPPFLWLHLIEPHEPYHPPAPWAGRLDPDYDGELTGDSEHLWSIRKRWLVPTPRDLEHLVAEYDENLAYVDDVVGRVLARLEAAGLGRDAIVAVFSDHGEGFLQHDGKVHAGLGHGSTAYEEMSRIPLIVRLPRGLAPAGVRPAGLVGGTDLLPTLADLTGVPPLAGVGRSFAPLLFEPGRAGRAFAIAHAASPLSRRFVPGSLAIWSGTLKYIHSTGDRPELYDLERDAGERTNLALERPVLAGYLAQRLREETQPDLDGGVDWDAPESDTIDAETLETLRALGYAE